MWVHTARVCGTSVGVCVCVWGSARGIKDTSAAGFLGPFLFRKTQGKHVKQG